MLNSSKTFQFVCFSLLFSLSQSSWSQKVSMVTTDWEPFYSSSLESGGVITEIVHAAFKRAGHQSQINWYPWVRALKMVEHGAADLVLGAYYSKERDQIYNYSEPIFSVNVGLIAKKSLGISSYTDLKSLKSYTFGVMRGWVYTNEFDNANYLKKKILVNQVFAVRMLFAERVHIVAASIPVFKHEAALLGKDIDHDTIVLEPLLDSKPLYLMFSKAIPNSLELVKDFNLGMQSIRADGTLQSILAKHGF